MIFRTHKQSRFTTVDNRPFQDKRLRWDTRGLLAYLLTKPDGWEIRIEDLLKQEEPEDGGRPTGREKVMRMLRELKSLGYLHRTQEHGADGRFVTISNIYENPEDNPFFGEEEAEDVDDLADPEDVAPAPVIPTLPGSFTEEPEPLTAVGKADHGATAVGKAVRGTTVDGSTVGGKADHIIITDLSNNGEGVKPDEIPSHLRGYLAQGLTGSAGQLQTALRQAFSFLPEAALDSTITLQGEGITEWGIEHQRLLDALLKVSKGVTATTLFRDWLTLWKKDGTAEDVLRLFGKGSRTADGRATSWWHVASGMKGLPWPSQVANNIQVAREWEANRVVGDLETAANGSGRKKVSNSTNSLQRYAERAAAARSNGQ